MHLFSESTNYPFCILDWKVIPQHVSKPESSRNIYIVNKPTLNCRRLTPIVAVLEVVCLVKMLRDAMTESTQFITSFAWSSVVLILATTMPLFLFWKPLRNIINEYRLYKRCQQYPYIVVCKESASTSGRKSDDGIVGQFFRIGIWLVSNLFLILRFMIGTLITVLLSTMNKKEQETIEESPTLLSGSIETEEQTTNSADSGSQVKLPSGRSVHFSVSEDSSKFDSNINRSQSEKQNSYVMMPSEDIFESSNHQTEKANIPMQHGKRAVASAPFVQERQSGGFRRRRSTVDSRPSNHRSQSQKVATTSTQTTVTKPIVIDSSSLSEKMRKRRSNGERIMGYNAITGEGDEGSSRKRRKLNVGRMPLQGCVSRHPGAGAWQTTRILDKREREEREERLLRSMSRKRAKPTVEPPKPAAPATASITAPASSTPAFSFGQTPAAASTPAPTAKQDAPAAAATSAPAFQFGATATAKPNEGASSAAEKKSEPAKTPAFSFGATTTNATTSSDKAPAAAASASTPAAPAPPAPAAPFTFGATAGATGGDTKAKEQPAKAPAFTFGSTPAAAPTATTPAAPAQAPPSFGTNGVSSTNTASSSAPAPSFGAPAAAMQAAPAPAFGATPAAPAPAFGSTPAAPAPAFGATPAPSFGAPAAVAPTFGATSAAPAPAFGATPAAPALAFGSTPAPAFGATPAAPAPAFGSTPTAPAPAFGLTPAPAFGAAPAPAFGTAPAPAFGAPAAAPAPAFGGFTAAPATTFGATPSQSAKPANGASFSFGNTKENTNPGGFNSGFQASAPSNGFLKQQPTNAPTPGFGGSNFGGTPGFSAGAPPAANTGASARRMARRARSRRR